MKRLILIISVISSITSADLYPSSLKTDNRDSVSIYKSKEFESFNSFYTEIFGNGGSFSINYERMIFDNFNFRLGIGGLLTTSSSNTGEHTEFGGVIFLMLNYLINVYGNNFIELGAGPLYQGTKSLGTFSIGYGYRPKTGGFLFRLSFDMKPNVKNKFLPWFGIGIGIQF